MNKILLLFALCVTGLTSTISASPKNFASNKVDGDSLITTPVIPSVEEMFLELETVTGPHNDFELREADVLNLEASVSHHKKYISYNPVYIDWINSITGDKWAVMTLIAHEMGHHIKGHTSGRK